MLIQEKIGRIDAFSQNKKMVDWLLLEWYETRKRILRKTTTLGKEILLKFLQQNPELTEGDVLYENESSIIVVSVLPCQCIVIVPKNMFEMASVCYEIGNKHLPLFYEKDQLLVPYEKPLHTLLLAQGYQVNVEDKKLLQPLKTTVAAHSNESGETLFSKIMKLKKPEQ